MITNQFAAKVIACCLCFCSISIAADFDHSLFDSLLSENIKDGLVNYSNLETNPDRLIRYLAQLENVNPSEFENWNDENKIAFWINAYNAITIYGILQNYPINYGSLFSRIIFPKSSVWQISEFWKTEFKPIMGKNITLDNIEHEILRKKFNEPRIHFTLVCASMGCPVLKPYAYDSDSLELQLERATRDFISTKGAIIDNANNRLNVTKIFQWYGKDFQASEIPPYLLKYDDDKQGFLKFIIEHSDEDVAVFIRENNPKIKFSKYDWSLNELIR